MIYSIQILRGLAAIMVVFVHIQYQVEKLGAANPFNWMTMGGAGVDIFFVISGFIIWVTSQSPKMTIWSFLHRRIIRIVPLYWIVTGFVVFAALVVPSFMSSTVFNVYHVIASFAFLPYPHPVLHDPYPVLVPGWSLNYEAFFYLLFGLSLFLPNRLSSLCACLVVLFALAVAGFMLKPTNYLFYYYTDPIILEFGFGILLGALYTHGPKPPLWIGLVAIPIGAVGVLAGGLAGMVDDHHLRFYAIGLPAALVVFGVTVAKRYHIDPTPPLLIALGDASYSVYLTHVILVPIGARAWTMVGLGHSMSQMVLFVIFEVVAAAIGGWLVHRFVERPILDGLRRLSSEGGSVAKSMPIRPLSN